MSDIPAGYRMGKGLSDEARDALQATINATVGTLNEDGSINLAHVWFLHDDGRLYFETASTTRKARNAAARGVASMLIGHSDIDVRAEGRARVLRGDEARQVNGRIRAKYGTNDAQDRFFDSIDDCAVEIHVDRWRTWTNTALRDGIRAVAEGAE